jgi:hypothetical protein
MRDTFLGQFFQKHERISFFFNCAHLDCILAILCLSDCFLNNKINTIHRQCYLLYLLEVTSELFHVYRSSRFGKLQGIQCALAGRNLYMRFTCSTGDAMGMNMVSKGVEDVLGYLQNDFPDMDLISLSGLVLPFCYSKEKLVLHSFNKTVQEKNIRQLNTM